MILSATVSSAVKFTNCFIAGTLFPCCLHNVMAYSVAEWLVCWTQVLKGLGSDCSCNAVITVLGELFTPIVPLFTKQRNW